MVAVRFLLCLPTLLWLLLPQGMCFCEVASWVGLPRACQGPASTDLGHPDSEDDHEHACPKVKDPASVPPAAAVCPMPGAAALWSDTTEPAPRLLLLVDRLRDPDPGGPLAVPLHLMLRALRN